MKYIALSIILIPLLFCSCRNSSTKASINRTDSTQVTTLPEAKDSISPSRAKITEDMAYQGVNNYCHSKYDWSVADENPSLMYVQKGEETDSAYQVIFRSYTGAFVYFYVDKSSGTTRMEEYVPSLNVRNDAGCMELFDYLK